MEKTAPLGALENSPSFPLSQRPEDDKLSRREWTYSGGRSEVSSNHVSK